jgi:hypothetical protein
MKKLALAALAIATIGGSVLAQPVHLQPGSVLIYPLFDSRAQSATVINLTNTNEDRANCGNGFRQGDVLAHYVYYGQEAGGGICLEFDRFENLTPADTLSVLASDHNPEGEVGFLTISANDPESGDLIDFDFLIGSAYVANAALDIMWAYTPYPFEGLGSIDTDNCGRDVIARAGDALLFDGSDYSAFPDVLYLDSFFEEQDGVFDNVLTLMSTSGQDYINEIDVLTWNNKEDKFSRTFKFVCHTSVELSQISAIARNLGGDEDEFAKETGWMKFNGRAVLDLAGNPAPTVATPAILGVFVQIVRSDFTAGHALHYSGTQSTALPVQL